LSCFIQTILCRDCKALYDAVIRLKISGEPAGKPGLSFQGSRLRKQLSNGPPVFESVVNRLTCAGARPYRWVQFKVCCPVSPTHKIRLWTDPGKCPKCGFYLEKGALPFRIWE
jgi:hypothetical protein